MPPTYQQAGRPLTVSTPLGADKLLLNGFSGTEGVSELFRYELDLLAPASSPVKFDALLGKPVSVKLETQGGQSRDFNGIVIALSQGGKFPGAAGGATFVRYRAEVAPKAWLLTQRVQSRTFQQKTVPEILKAVLQGVTLDDQTQGTFAPRDYCVQYRESDFDFASRLMEEEGIYYYFKHTSSAHTMVLANTPGSHAAVPGPEEVHYALVSGQLRAEDVVRSWEKSQVIRPGKVTLWDHCFELPGENLEASQATLSSVKVGTVDHSLAVANNSELEVYEYPGRYAQRFDGVAPGGGDQASQVQKIFQDNARTAGIRMQQETTSAVVVQGGGNVRHLAAGCKFKLVDHFDGDGAYVVTSVAHRAGLGGAYLQDDAEPGFHYENRFTCIPLALPFRPPLKTPRPRIDGTQTAVVVGPSGQEIFTDKYGRVKVQFPWDRAGKKDANSSCWVRVSTTWAGKQWGFVQIPRIGQEVIVAYEEGDPDRPVITGCVYNAGMMPPFTLPDTMTQSGTKSRSSPKGAAENFNQLWFEDKKDEELVYFHAEKNFDRVVENNDTLKVGFEKKDKGDRTVEVFNNETYKVGAGQDKADQGSQTIDVFNSQTLTVGSGKTKAKEGSQTVSVFKDRTTTIETGNESLTVKKGNRTVDVKQGNDTHTVDTGNREVTVKTGNDTHNVNTGNRETNVKTGNDTHNVKTGNRVVNIDLGSDQLTIKVGNQTTKLNVGKSTTEALQGITLKVGPSSIEITPAGVTIKGMTVTVQGQVQTQVKAPICQVNGDGMLMMKGGVTMIN